MKICKRAAAALIALWMLLAAIGCSAPGIGVRTSGTPTVSSGPDDVVSTPSANPESGVPSSGGENAESGSSLQTPDPTPSVTPDPSTPTPEKTKVSSFSMLTAGDNLLHRGILKEGQDAKRTGVNEDYYFDKIYAPIRAQVSAADYAIINQESIVLPKRYLSGKTHIDKTKGVSFCTPPENLDSLVRTGFDAIDMANNHALDMGSAGLQWALDYIRTREDLQYFGAFYDEEDRSVIRTIEVNGIKVALLAYTYGTNVSTEQANSVPGFRFLVPYIDDEKMVEELKKANEIADFTVVFMHWGTEHTFQPNDEQRRVASLLAENGAGIIVGHHTHTIQPIEYVSDGKGGRILCAYSLGTLISNMDNDWNMLAGLFTFDIVKYSDGSVSAENPLFTPTIFFYDMDYMNSRILYFNELTASLAAKHGIGNYPKDKTQKNTMTIEKMNKYLYETIDEVYLPAEYRR